MKRILVENIADGMILAKEVCGASGNALLNKGCTLNTALGRRLKNWGILFVHVEGEDDSAEAQSTKAQASPQEIQTKLEQKFSAVMGNPIMKKLFAVTYQFKVQKGAPQ